MTARRALITGIGGQDGSFLAEFLVEHGYEVTGIVHRPAATYGENLAGVAGRVELVEADVLDQGAMSRVLAEQRPHEVYNLAAPSFVPRSWDEPVRADHERWRELVAPGGHLLFHDAVGTHGYGSDYPGVVRLVAEVECDDRDFERRPGAGSITHFTRRS